MQLWPPFFGLMALPVLYLSTWRMCSMQSLTLALVDCLTHLMSWQEADRAVCCFIRKVGSSMLQQRCLADEPTRNVSLLCRFGSAAENKS